MVVAATLSMVASASGGPSASTVPVQEIRTKAGISAWLVEDHTLPLIAMDFSFSKGSASDPVGKEGVSYFLSGMLDEGAGDLGAQAFQGRMDDLAVKFSASSEMDDFVISFRTLSKNRTEAFSLLKSALHSPRFDPEPLEKVRKQIENQMKREAEDPEAMGTRAFMALAFGAHPYAHPEKGTLDTLKLLSAQDLRSFKEKLFSREGLKISVVGDIGREELEGVLDDLFGALPEKSELEEPAEVVLPEASALKVVPHPIPQSVISFGFEGLKRSDPDFIPAYVLNFVLGAGGFGSRLMEEVREKRGLTYGIYTHLIPLEHGALFSGSVSTMNEKAKETLDLVRSEISKLAEEGPTPTELQEAKDYLIGSFALRFDSNRKISSQLNGLQRQGLGVDYVNTRNDLIAAVTLEDTKRVARRLLKPDQLLVSIVGAPEGLSP